MRASVHPGDRADDSAWPDEQDRSRHLGVLPRLGRLGGRNRRGFGGAGLRSGPV